MAIYISNASQFHLKLPNFVVLTLKLVWDEIKIPWCILLINCRINIIKEIKYRYKISIYLSNKNFSKLHELFSGPASGCKYFYRIRETESHWFFVCQSSANIFQKLFHFSPLKILWSSMLYFKWTKKFRKTYCFD